MTQLNRFSEAPLPLFDDDEVRIVPALPSGKPRRPAAPSAGTANR